MGFETPEEGYLAKILIPAGSRDVPIGKLVCIIVENQEDVAAFKDFKDDGAGHSAPKRAAAPSSPPPVAPAAAAPAAAPSGGNFPSHSKVMLPALSPTMETGRIASWEKNEGDKLNEGKGKCVTFVLFSSLVHVFIVSPFHVCFVVFC